MNLSELFESDGAVYQWREKTADENKFTVTFDAESCKVTVKGKNETSEKHYQSNTPIWALSVEQDGVANQNENKINATVVAIVRLYASRYDIPFMIVSGDEAGNFVRVIERAAAMLGFSTIKDPWTNPDFDEGAQAAMAGHAHDSKYVALKSNRLAKAKNDEDDGNQGGNIAGVPDKNDDQKEKESNDFDSVAKKV